MRKINNIIHFVIVSIVLASCAGGSGGGLEAKKEELETLRAEAIELNSKIETLEKEVAALDPDAIKGVKEILISSVILEEAPFFHKIDVRGSVDSRNNISVSAETSGRIERIYVTEGQYVKAGQLLMKLDSDILENNISEVETNLELARVVFQRQRRLWQQNIGTEIQYLQAKTNKESLERRLTTLRSQLAQSSVKAPISGTVEEVGVRIGEMAMGGLPLLQIVSNDNMYIKADVSEAFMGTFRVGDRVDVNFPVQNRSFNSKIAAVGRLINSNNRTFTLEVSLPRRSSFDFRPNQVTILSLVDYRVENAITVPTSVILTDNQGKFVYVVSNEGGSKIAKKARVEVGKSFEDRTEILSGLSSGTEIIEKGYRDVTDGVEVKLATASL